MQGWSETHAQRDDGAQAPDGRRPDPPEPELPAYRPLRRRASLVDADASLVHPEAEEAALGVGCMASELSGYFATVWPDGYYTIGLDPESSEELAFLADRTARGALAGAVSRTAFDWCARAGLRHASR